MSTRELLPSSPETPRFYPTGQWRGRALNLFILFYLTLQLILPINGFRHDKGETRGNFSWNMYSSVYQCEYNYEWVSRYGQVIPIDITTYFNRPGSTPKAMHADTLPIFHEWLCRKMREERPQGALRAYVSVRENDDPIRNLVPPNTWICDPLDKQTDRP